MKLACELPETSGRSLSTWDCGELARALVRAGVTDSISATSVQRILASQKLRPWRVHHWLSAKVPRDDHGKLVQAWLRAHPRFQMHFTPVHCSWMNQVEQWFSILTRKRLRAPNFDDVGHLEACVTQFIAEWNEIAKPFAWTPKSFAKVLDRQATPLREAA